MDLSEIMNSQVLKLSILAALLSITPFLALSLRSTYLYFLFNLLIIFLGAEAGLLSSVFSNPTVENKNYNTTSHVISTPLLVVTTKTLELSLDVRPKKVVDLSSIIEINKPNKLVRKPAFREIASSLYYVEATICLSKPSLFFIGGEEEEVEKEESSGEELFTKAETFIGNFYKQLKMQREESWKKLDGIQP